MDIYLRYSAMILIEKVIDRLLILRNDYYKVRAEILKGLHLT